MGDSNADSNCVVWMEIPVADLDRACRFYSAVMGREVGQEQFEDCRYGVLVHGDGVGGCLVIDPENISNKGVLVYLNTNGRLRDAVAQVAEQGGTVLEDVRSIDPFGFMATILDSEGNRVALHSNTDA